MTVIERYDGRIEITPDGEIGRWRVFRRHIATVYRVGEDALAKVTFLANSCRSVKEFVRLIAK